MGLVPQPHALQVHLIQQAGAQQADPSIRNTLDQEADTLNTGEKTVAIEAFEGNNLVLVDEGHRGSSGAEVGHWMRMRSQL